MSSQTLKINLRLMIHIYSVTSGCVNGIVVCIVAEKGVHKVHVYNATWFLVTSFGGQRSDDGELDTSSAMMSDQGYIYVGDTKNNCRLSMFTSDSSLIIINHIMNVYTNHIFSPLEAGIYGLTLFLLSR